MLKKIGLAALILLTVGLVTVFATGQKEAPALGTEENPIVWAFVPSGEMERVSSGAQSVADLLHQKTGLYFKTLVATEYAGVIEALRAKPATAQMTSLATFAYITAADYGVSQAALVSVRNNSAFYKGGIIVRTDSGINKIADLKGKTFARPDPLSTSGWIIPSIVLKSQGINPSTDIKVVDAGSHDAAVAAVYNGDVAGGACYVDARTRIQDQYPDVLEKVKFLQESAPIPNDGVQFHPSVPQALRDKIVNALLEIAQTEEGKAALNTAYQWTALERHDDSFYDPFRQVLQAAGVKAADFMPK
jgi:phosphonate transport system substrate-binding protein